MMQVPFDRLAVSVVSHGQGTLVRPLLQDLSPLLDLGSRVVLTLNIDEDESFLADGPSGVEILRNPRPLGFGANHNQAFRKVPDASAFAVVNPDIRVDARTVFTSLLPRLSRPGVGAVAPAVVGPDGQAQDSVRRFPTPARIGSRMLRRLAGASNPPDYDLHGGLQIVDWAAGMFVVYSSTAYASVSGFDERYFMYLEDADICRRLSQGGWATVLDTGVAVVHDARRSSGRSLRHLRWHLASMTRFFLSR